MATSSCLVLVLCGVLCHKVNAALLGRDTPSKCQSLRPPINGLIQCSQNATLLVCTATCNSGYGFDSAQSSETRVCDDSTGTWKYGDTLPTCTHVVQPCNSSLLPGLNDSQFSASSVWMGVKDYYFGADRARLDSIVSPGGSVVNSGGWRPATNTLDQYIQVKLNAVTRITGIITKGRHVIAGDTANEYVSKFRVLHSLDGSFWEPYSSASISDQFLDGNSDRDTPVMNTFTCPFDALYVRVNPLVWHENIALRFELLGCPPTIGPNKCLNVGTASTISASTTERITTTPKQTTTPQPHLCQPIPPPTHGRVNCEAIGDQLTCVANCEHGYGFSTGDVLVKRVCFQHSGLWAPEPRFPYCVGQLPTPTPAYTYTNQCLNVQKKCEKIHNGDYQACAACHFFATCSEGFMYVRACPEQLVFDSVKKQCDYHSNTCTSQSILQPIG